MSLFHAGRDDRAQALDDRELAMMEREAALVEARSSSGTCSPASCQPGKRCFNQGSPSSRTGSRRAGLSCGPVIPCSGGDDPRYTFVGHGIGQYEQVDKYNYVGDGSGDFTKVQKTTYYGFRLRKLWLSVLLAGVFVLVARYAYATAQGGDSSDDTSTTPAPGGNVSSVDAEVGDGLSEEDCRDDGAAAPQTQWSARKRNWCCVNFSRGCSATAAPSASASAAQPPPAAAAAASPAGVEYDCTLNADKWQTAWSVAKKHWCCTEKNLHCTEAAPSAAAVGVSAGGEGGQGQGLDQAAEAGGQASCDKICVYSGWSATCRNRVKWSMRHKFKDEGVYSCRLAHGQVLGQCEVCAECSAAAVGCTDPVSTGLIAGIGPEDQLKANDPGGAGAGAAALPPHETSLPYDCNNGLATFATSWSKGKQTWCCMQQHKGCPKL